MTFRGNEEPACSDYNQEYIRQRMDGAPVDRNLVIITEPMIIDCLNELLPKGEEGKYARMVKLDINTVTYLKMEYRCKKKLWTWTINANFLLPQLETYSSNPLIFALYL